MKQSKCSTVTKKIISLTSVLLLCTSLFAGFSNDNFMEVQAASNPYTKSYNICETVNYATSWVKQPNKTNPDYKEINDWAKDNCACFVSESLTAGGVKIPKAYRITVAGKSKYMNRMWSVAFEQYNYLTKTLGYSSEVATDKNVHIGDAVYYDWENNGSTSLDHVAICIGQDAYNKPVIAEHSPFKTRVWNKTETPIRTAYVVHMTNAVGHADVTNEYRGKSVNILSLKNKKYVSSDTDNSSANNTIAIANRTSVGGWEKFMFVDNDFVATGNVTEKSLSICTYTGKYLSSYISEKSIPVKNTNNKSAWEAFRVFRSGNTEYLLSLINGKFILVHDDNKLYAQGEGGWAWESFDIKLNTTISFNSVSGPGNLVKGNRASIYGTITSTNSNISTITATVTRRSDSKQMISPQTVTVNSMSYKLQLSTLDYKLPFGTLDVGNYRITYNVRCTDGTNASKSVDFNIISNHSSVKSYTIRSSSGAKVRTDAGTTYSVIGGLARGSVVYYDQTKSANGYTWYHITRADAKSGSWGSYVGKWVAGV